MCNKFKYNVLFLKAILLGLFWLSYSYSFAQDIYRTQNGSVLITTVSSDSIITFSTKQVAILVNNNQATFSMKIDKSSFVTNNVSINEELVLMRSDEIIFSGKFDLESINQQDHVPIDFDIEGVISTNYKTLFGRGRLEHISTEGNISCLLTLRFNINKDDLGLNLENLELKDEVQLDVVQVLLNN